MAQTMLYVNEHVHNDLWGTPVDDGVIRSFAPGDYIVATVASGETVVVSGHPAERGAFELFATALGRTDLIDDTRFVDVRSRMTHFDELRDEILATAAEIPDAGEFERRFAQHRLAVGVLRSVREVCDTEWAHERGAVAEVSDRGGGLIRVPNAPWRFSDAPDVGLHGDPRYRGEDNRDVLSELLGLDDADLDRLEWTGVLSSRLPRSPSHGPKSRS
jgi:crotonobetainyl-CoA:carnitine CoA-transferase CaiB-like acyl-CoA transferase